MIGLPKSTLCLLCIASTKNPIPSGFKHLLNHFSE